MVALASGIVTAVDLQLVVRCRANLLAEVRVAMEVGERITAVGARTITVVPQAGGVAVPASSTIETSRGREMTELTTTLLVGAEAVVPRSMTTSPTRLSKGAAVLRFTGP